MHINVCFTPQDYLRHNFAEDHTAVVIDVLRATTTIITALANGCRQFIPVATVEEALLLKSVYPDALLGGERNALRIADFDLGNSPFEYSPLMVGDKTIIMSTTNGTVALKTAEEAAKVYVGAFVNAAALCNRLAAEGNSVVLLCAGTQGRFSLEDALCAGLIAHRLGAGARLGDSALAARAMYQEISRVELVELVTQSSHATHLIKAGFAADVAYCLQSDLLAVVPEFVSGVIA